MSLRITMISLPTEEDIHDMKLLAAASKETGEQTARAEGWGGWERGGREVWG